TRRGDLDEEWNNPAIVKADSLEGVVARVNSILDQKVEAVPSHGLGKTVEVPQNFVGEDPYAQATRTLNELRDRLTLELQKMRADQRR
ncbi:MAG: hypothetical protein KDD42_00150, partial [Bdellovibrionales bacterium]|nr:hypothetical protein [Bdellovibrionales bacterium]